MLKEGDAAPEFKLQDDCGCTLTLKNFRGRPLVIYFFPRADTPG
jgi:peroxiredoxin Q/BCP